MSKRTLMITGASGGLGQKALETLRTLTDDTIVAGTRRPEAIALDGVEARKVDFDDAEGLVKAFAGVDRLLLISTDAVGEPGKRARQHSAAIAAARAAGVKHLLYTSFQNPTRDSAVSIAEDHRLTEQALADSGIPYTTLRNNLYTDLLLQSAPQAIAGGQLFTARPTGAISYVTRDDCAVAAATALAADTDETRALDITGPEALTGDDLAALLTELSGTRVTHVPLLPAELRGGLIQAGLPEAVADLLVSFEVEAEADRMAVAPGDVQAVTGQAPTSVKAFLAATLEAAAAK